MEKFQRHSIPWQFSVVDKCFKENKKFSIKTSSYEQNILRYFEQTATDTYDKPRDFRIIKILLFVAVKRENIAEKEED